VPIKLHRCGNLWVKIQGHPCWRVQKALDDQGIEYEVVKGPLSRKKRDHIVERTGQRLYPAIEFENGSWYREESKEMEHTIREGRLMQQQAAP
jgi:glutaredoxin